MSELNPRFLFQGKHCTIAENNNGVITYSWVGKPKEMLQIKEEELLKDPSYSVPEAWKVEAVKKIIK